MPLKDHTPQIDVRTWQDIVDEVRSRIPHYTPEWTDFNDSDPGITLTQVFAHLAEMLLFRMNMVPELAYVKFLELIGIELTPAQAAQVEVSFVVADSVTDATVLIPQGTQVSAPGDDGPPLVFETERSLTALACQLLAVQVDDGAQFRNVTRSNAEATAGFDPLGADPREGAALVLGFGFPDGHPNQSSFPALAIDIAFWSQADARAPLMRQCGGSDNRPYASAQLQWEGWSGSLWVQLDGLSDDTLALTRSGHMVLRVPSNAALARDFLGDYEALNNDSGEAQPPLFWLRLRVLQTAYEVAPRLLALRINTVPALQAQTVRNEVLGGTNGEPNQSFTLANKPVLKSATRPLLVSIDQGQGAQDWWAVNDLLGAGPRDRQLALHYSSGELITGDGENGAVPVANAANPDANVVVAEYRFGGGSQGNVAARAINNLLTPIVGLDGGATSNLFGAAGGADEEGLDAAKKRAARSLRARGRAVTAEDFELLAQAAGNVARAKALPLTHPQFPGIKVPGAVSVIVVPGRRSPAVPSIGTPPPLPSDGLLRLVCDYIDQRRLLTTEVFVLAPTYVPLQVQLQVVIDDNADSRRVKEDVELALRNYFDPLLGGDEGTGWPFGGALRYAKIVQRVFKVDGVDSVPDLRLTVDGDTYPACADVPLANIAPNALPNLLAHSVQVLSQREAQAQEMAA